MYVLKSFPLLLPSPPVIVNELNDVSQNVFHETVVLKDALRKTIYVEKFKVYFLLYLMRLFSFFF